MATKSTTTEPTPSQRARARGPATLDHLKKKQPRAEVVTIPLDDDLAAAADEARRLVADAELRYRQARATRASDVDLEVLRLEVSEAKDALSAAESDLEEASVKLKFVAIGRQRMDALKRLHPATDEDRKEVEDYRKKHPDQDMPDPDVHDETFSAALVLAACAEPQLTREYVGTIFGVDPEPWRDEDDEPFVPDPDVEPWNYGELSRLVMAATVANTQQRGKARLGG